MTLLARETLMPLASNPMMYVGDAALMEYRSLIMNDRRRPDGIFINKITGYEDPDVEASSEPNPDRDGELPLDARYRGMTITLDGVIRAGSFNRKEYLWERLKDAFDVLDEYPLYFRWLDWVEYFTDSQALFADWGYDAGSSTLSIASDGSGLAPTTTANKQILLAPNGTFSTTPAAGAKYSYGDQDVIVAANHATMTGVLFGPELRRTSANQKLRVIYDHANTRLALYKVVAGVPTLLDSVTVTLVAGTTYYIEARIEGGVVIYSVWNAVPTNFGTPLATKTFTLSGGDQTTFPSTAAGYRSGLYWTPNSTADRVKLFDLGALNAGDAQISCRKFAKIEPGDDTQNESEYRKSFLLSLRCSAGSIQSRKATIFSAVPSVFSLVFPGGGGGFTFPADGSGLIFGASLGTATNLGRAPAFPIIRMYGPLPNPAVVNSLNNTRVAVVGTIADGDYFEFDTQARTVFDSNGASKYDMLTEDTNWLYLEKGANPLLFGSDSVGANSLVRLTYQHTKR